jgi:transcriptional antiterminator RfaH
MGKKAKNRRRLRNRKDLKPIAMPRAKQTHRVRASRIDESLAWYAVYTQPKAELKAKADIEAAGVAVFTPLLWQESYRTRQCYMAPLFPRYLFVGMGPPAFREVLEARGVVDLLGMNGAPLPVPVPFLTRLVRIQNGEEMLPEDIEIASDWQLQPGDMVKIIEGPLAGHSARVDLSQGAMAKLVVNLFGRWTETRLPLVQLERI